MVRILRVSKDSYDSKCEELGKNPNEIKSLKIKKSDTGYSIDVLGNDNESSFSITDKFSNDSNSIQILPRSFARQIGITLKNRDSSGFLSDSPYLDALVYGIFKGLDYSVKNSIKYYEYLNEKAKIVEDQNKEETIFTDNPEKDRQYREYSSNNTTIRPRVNEHINESALDILYKSTVLPKATPTIAIRSKENGNLTHKAYVFDMAPRSLDGYLMFIEPVIIDGRNKMTKIAYFPSEFIDKESAGNAVDDTFFQNLVKKFHLMSYEDFATYPGIGSYNARHRDPEAYIATVDALLNNNFPDNTDEAKKELMALFEGKAPRDIIGAIKGVHRSSVDAFAHAANQYGRDKEKIEKKNH